MIPVQYIISTQQNIPLLIHLKTALEAGCKWIQLCINEGNLKKRIETALQAKNICRENEATFIIENDIELVKAIDGDGIHITDNKSVQEVRQQLGEGFLIGVNANNSNEIIDFKQQSADYICYGPYSGESLLDTPHHLSLNDYKKTIADIQEKEVFLPVCAFGNIRPDEVGSILETGIRGISVFIDEELINLPLISSTLTKFINIQ